MGEAHPMVLLVEDDELVRRAVLAMLESAGISALAAESAEQGLEEFETHPEISLGILDMVLPGKSGLDLAAELGRRRPGFRILYMSGLGESIAMKSISHFNPDQVLVKPFQVETFIQRVTDLLETAVMTAGGTAPATAGPRFPWDRLVEASDMLDDPACWLISYRDTAAGFAVAVTHIAVLRVAAISYSFRYTGNPELPLGLAALPEDRAQAMALIERIGLGADIAPSV